MILSNDYMYNYVIYIYNKYKYNIYNTFINIDFMIILLNKIFLSIFFDL